MTVIKRVVAPLLAGALANAAFPDAGMWPVLYLSIGVLWWTLTDVGAWKGFGVASLYGLGLFLPHVWWANYAAGLIPWLALAISQAFMVGLFGAAWAHVVKSKLLDAMRWLQPLVFAVLWLGVEQLRSAVPFGGFPWGRLAFSQADAPLVRYAWYGGVPLVTFTAVLVGSLLAYGVATTLKHSVVKGVVAIFTAAVVFAAPLMIHLDSRSQSGDITLGIVQGNVPDLGLDSFSQARLVTENHRDESLRLAAHNNDIDLLVWPENSSDFDPRVDAQTMDTVLEAAQAFDVPLLLGTQEFLESGHRYNTSLLLGPNGMVIDQYYKQKPVPFAEYIPMRDFARKFSKEVDRVSHDMLAGSEPAVLGVPVERLGRVVTVGAVICFEVVYDDVLRGAINNGAEVLIVQTNNASFGRSPESTQQLAASRLRAVETGRSTIQISTVGVSGVISPTGQVSNRMDLFTADSAVVTVPLRTEISPAVRLGSAINILSFAVPLLILGGAITRRLSSRWGTV